MNFSRPLIGVAAIALLTALPLAAQAQGWTGSGELGLAISSGNSDSENLNGKLGLVNEDDQWKHSAALTLLRAKGEVLGDFDGDGDLERSNQLTANRYELSLASAYKASERTSWIASLRYQDDDFASFETQTTIAISHGYQWIDSETTKLRTEVGPGYRRSKSAATGDTDGEGILRGGIDFRQTLTENTELFNTFLVEAGDDNTFAQNDLGVQVSMNDRLALKAGLQARHNTDVSPGKKKTDTLTTLNLVFKFN